MPNVERETLGAATASVRGAAAAAPAHKGEHATQTTSTGMPSGAGLGANDAQICGASGVPDHRTIDPANTGCRATA